MAKKDDLLTEATDLGIPDVDETTPIPALERAIAAAKAEVDPAAPDPDADPEPEPERIADESSCDVGPRLGTVLHVAPPNAAPLVLATGGLLPPGERAHDVPLDHDTTRWQLAAGVLIELPTTDEPKED